MFNTYEFDPVHFSIYLWWLFTVYTLDYKVYCPKRIFCSTITQSLSLSIYIYIYQLFLREFSLSFVLSKNFLIFFLFILMRIPLREHCSWPPRCLLPVPRILTHALQSALASHTTLRCFLTLLIRARFLSSKCNNYLINHLFLIRLEVIEYFQNWLIRY